MRSSLIIVLSIWIAIGCCGVAFGEAEGHECCPDQGQLAFNSGCPLLNVTTVPPIQDAARPAELLSFVAAPVVPLQPLHAVTLTHADTYLRNEVFRL